jgi:hypothetical protein
MKVIKFELPLLPTERNAFEVPEDFTPIAVAMPGERITVWGETYFEKPREAPSREMTFFVVGTGWEVKRDVVQSHYLGTVHQLDGYIIWHMYWGWNRFAIRYTRDDYDG